MRYGKLFCLLSFSAIAILGIGLPTLSQDSNSDTTTEQSSPSDKVSETPESKRDCFSDLKDIQNGSPFRSKRVELYYYRNAANIVGILSKLPIEGAGCATTLPLNNITAGVGVGRGGGNIISLYGTEPYIENAQRFITSLDLPLPGIDLQLWGVQISSKDPDKLAETMAKVRWRIGETKRLLGDALAAIEGLSQFTLQEQNPHINIDTQFTEKMRDLGYEDAIDGLGGELSILEIFLVGLAAKNSTKFYQDLYDFLTKEETNKNGEFVAANKDLQPYFDALKNDTNRPPFERTLRSRGLEPYCIKDEKPKQQTENEDPKCKKWIWKLVPIKVNNSDSTNDSPKYYEDKITAKLSNINIA